MIILKSTDTLQVLLSGAVAANQPVLFAAFVDVDATTFAAKAADNSNGLMNGVTAVSWVAAPVSGRVRQAKYLSLYNADTASITVTVRINDGTNTRILQKVVLVTGDRLEYVDGAGFRTIQASGATSGMSNPMTTSQDIIVGGTAGAPGRLGVGAAGQALVVNSSGNLAYAGGESISEPVTALTNSSGTVAVNCALGDYFTLSLSANVTTWSFSNLPTANKAQTIMLEIKQDATGNRTAAWPSSFKWSGGAPALSTSGGATDVLALTTFDQGTTWRATLAKAFA